MKRMHSSTGYTPMLFMGIIAILIGNPFDLSEREEQIAHLADLSDEEIAKQFFISIDTVKTHFKKIRKKLGIRSRYEIPYVLDRPQGINSLLDEFQLSEIIDQLPVSITITIKKKNPVMLTSIHRFKLDALCNTLPP